MLIGIIKNNTNNEDYYIHLNIKNDINELSITHVGNQIIESLPLEKAKNLLKTILSSKLTFKEKEEDYDIYLDEANNKRYFKNGKENIFMFLENNGVDAISYFAETSKKNNTKIYKLVVGGVVFSLILSTVGLLHLAKKTTYEPEPLYELISIDTITSEEMVNLINSSPNLEEDEKETLINQVYFQFVLNNTDSETHLFHLRSSFTDITIKDYDGSQEEDIYGYYNPVDGNTIHMRSSMKQSNDYKKVLTHEFIHMTQNPNRYRYIQEGCTEIIRNEFYNQPYYGYTDMVWRIKILMEIVGPQPVIDCNYQSNPTSFEKAIKAYLSEEEANELLDLFTTTAQALYKDAETVNAVDGRIDELLAQMYYNKTGNSIKDDKLISDMYASNLFILRSVYNRTYFNPNSPYYNMESIVTEEVRQDTTLNINDVLKTDNVEKYKYTIIENREVAGIKRQVPVSKTTTDFSTIPTEYLLNVKIFFKDGLTGVMGYDQELKDWTSIDCYKKEEIRIPSIPSKFPDQIQKQIILNHTKEIEATTGKSM